MFVKIQLWMLIGYCITFVLYFITLFQLKEQGTDHAEWEHWVVNMFATVDNFFLLLYDWLLFE